jgi:hypothetical protein
MKSKKVIKHLKGDIETFKHEAAEDRKLIKDIKGKKKTVKKSAKKKTGKAKVKKVMHEFGAGKLHSGSKKGPVVTNPKKAIAIAMSEAGKSKKKKSNKK